MGEGRITPKEKAIEKLEYHRWNAEDPMTYDIIQDAIDIALQEQAKQIFENIADYWAGSEKYLDITEKEFNKLKSKWVKKE